MPEIPECLGHRYIALEDLIQELSALSSGQLSYEDSNEDSTSAPRVKLMCDYWNILKEDPGCGLTQAVKQRLSPQEAATSAFQQSVACYMAGKQCKGACSSKGENIKEALSSIKSVNLSNQSFHCNVDKCSHSSKSKSGQNGAPLSKALCNLKEAASFEKNCNASIMELMQTQEELKTKIQHLEAREKEGVKRLKEADKIWSSMEEAYKKKIAESFDRQKDLLKQLQEVEKSNTKWRKNMKDLEQRTKNVDEYQLEINEKINQKNNDIKCIETEIKNIKNRIESSKLHTEGTKKLMKDKKEVSDNKIAAITEEIIKLKATLKDVQNNKNSKERDGLKYVKEARDDLQTICSAMLQKKLENESLVAEKEGLEEELNFLKQSYNMCKDQCKNKEDQIIEEIKLIDKDIEKYKVECERCHQGVDTSDARRLCNDCSRCKEERECKMEGDQCEWNPDEDCVCITVKEKLLCNVFDNMYSVLEEKSKTPEGKAVADAILGCLKSSKNGKLSPEVKQLVQDFVMKTLKKNINLTVVGGAVKTRCEMDPEIFKQLMCCLKYIKEEELSKADKGTEAKKASCRRWESSNECNCPGGIKSCGCAKRVPLPPHKLCQSKENVNIPNPNIMPKESPKMESSCGPDRPMHAVPSNIGFDVSKSKPTTLGPFSNNMRAAQCVLGPESLNSQPKIQLSSPPPVPEACNKRSIIPNTENPSGETNCKSGKSRTKSKRDQPSRPRAKIIEEVMGTTIDMAPIQKVSYMMIKDFCDEY